MKKTYCKPSMTMAITETCIFICNSRKIHTDIVDDDIGYGGVDDGGQKDPASRRHRHTDWDDEDEDDMYY